MLSARDLRAALRTGRLRVRPRLRPAQIGPASIDLRLGRSFKTFRTNQVSLLDPTHGLPPAFMAAHRLTPQEAFILHPGSFVLADTLEWVTVADDLALTVEGKSTLARVGILVHTAGFVDPGFRGVLTLEISNQSDVAVALYPMMYICQVAAHPLSSPAEVPYHRRGRSRYLGARSAVAADPRKLFPRQNPG